MIGRALVVAVFLSFAVTGCTVTAATLVLAIGRLAHG